MKPNATERLNDIVNAAASCRSKIGFRILLVVAVLLAIVAAALVWNASLGLSVHDVTSLFDKSDIELADTTEDGLIMVIVRDSPEARKLLAGPQDIEIGGYHFSKSGTYPTPAQPGELLLYSSRGPVHSISVNIFRNDESELCIGVGQVLGFDMLFVPR